METCNTFRLKIYRGTGLARARVLFSFFFFVFSRGVCFFFPLALFLNVRKRLFSVKRDKYSPDPYSGWGGGRIVISARARMQIRL